MKVLFINNNKKLCGVYQYGLRVYDIIKKSSKYNVIYVEVETENECNTVIKTIIPDRIIYNWHAVTMPWSTDAYFAKSNIPTYVCNHDKYNWQFKHVIGIFIDMIDEDHHPNYSLPRPTFNYINNKYVDLDIVKIGSFGFGFANKGFQTLCRIVNEQFDKAIISLHIPFSHYCDTDGNQAKYIATECQNIITKPGIKLQITHHYMSNEELLDFLAMQTINIFAYDFLNNNGLSSCIDYAVSVNRPIGITNSYMFRHIINLDILVEYNSIMSIIKNGTEYINKLKDKWSHEKMINKFEYIMEQKI